MASIAEVGVAIQNDTVMQMARCSSDAHIQELIGSLMLGCSVVLLRPQGNMDLEYVMNVLIRKQITHLPNVPSYGNTLATFLQKQNISKLHYLRSFDIGGEFYFEARFDIQLLILKERKARSNY
jgi:non-ribosomal peptide synthetase component F